MHLKAGAVAGLAMLTILGCSSPAGHGQPGVTVQPATGFLQLSVPAPEELVGKKSAGAFGNVWFGSQYWGDETDFPNVDKIGDLARFRPQSSVRGYAYAMYLFFADRAWDSLWLNAVWQTPPEPAPQPNHWIGLADFHKETIRWYTQSSAGNLYFADASPYTLHGSDNNYYVIVFIVVTGTESRILEEVSLLNSPGALRWDSEIVKSQAGPFVASVSLAIDSADEPRILYESNNKIFYALKSDETFAIETIADGAHFGCDDMLALDSTDKPHLAYLRSLGDHIYGIYYVTKPNEDWSQQQITVDTSLRLGNLELDAADRPHLVYYRSSDASINYAYQDEGGWVLDRVKGPCEDEFALSLTPDSIPQIAYQQNSMLWYAYFKAPTWWFAVVDHESGAGRSPVLAHDDRGRIHLAYRVFHPFSHSLKYALWDGENSVITDIGNETGSTGNIDHPMLRIDSQNLPHIAYLEQEVYLDFGDSYTALEVLKYARFDGSEWLILPVYMDISLQGMFGFDLDRADRPHFCFISWEPVGESNLYYARPR